MRPGAVMIPPESGSIPSATAPVSHFISSVLSASEKTKLIRAAAFDLLARREHTKQELTTKLTKRFNKRMDLEIDFDVIVTVVEGLSMEGLQSDERYLENFVHGRKQQGYGPLRIAQEIRQKSAAADARQALGDSNSALWKERAREVRIKKFGARLPATPKEKAQQMRFLQYRGFNMEQIKFAMKE